MKNFFKYLGLITILLFGFYYTEKMSNIVVNNSNLMKEINENAKHYNVSAISASIDEDYIVPGLNGYQVNILKSYNNMRHLETFNNNYLEYDIVKPVISLDNNKDKIIKKGNRNKQSVSIIVKDNYDIIEYLKDKDISINRLITENTFDKNSKFEQINNDQYNYDVVEGLLNKSNLNNNICIINYLDNCKDNQYLIQSDLVLNNYNYNDIIKGLENGAIIIVEDNVNLSLFKLFLNQINYQNLKIDFLSNLIKEERD